MDEYRITFRVVYEVEAKNPAEAEQLARDQFEMDDMETTIKRISASSEKTSIKGKDGEVIGYQG